MKWLEHFKLVCHHRRLVRQGCFKLGLYRQGLMHDLSKFSPTEFRVGAKYFQGYRSPNDAERAETGISRSWLHHKGRNRHHFEYWTDMNRETRRYEAVPMPRRFLAEKVMDRIAACKTYQGEKYTDGSALAYFENSAVRELLHPQTRQELTYLLTMLRDEGEDKTFAYLRESVLKGKPFPWETAEEEK